MKYRLISASFVGIWEKPFVNPPSLDRKFCLDLFDDPYNTTSGITPEGFVIAKQFTTPPHPSVVINPNRIQITELSITKTCDLAGILFNTLTQTNPSDMVIPFSSIGINMEHEWLDLTRSSQQIFRESFFQTPFSPTDLVVPYDLRFEIRSENNLKMNLILQPRSGLKNAIFVGSNDDRFWSEKPVPSRDMLIDMFTDSANALRKRLDPVFAV
jgi:hypothetical protein